MQRNQDLKAIIDTREKNPLDLAKYGLSSEVGTLSFGDYSLLQPDLRSILVIERKSLSDFIACVTWERDRFEREIDILRGFPYRFVVCEFNLTEVLREQYRSKVKSQCVFGSIARWLSEGINFVFVENHDAASYFVAGILRFLGDSLLLNLKSGIALHFELDTRDLNFAEIEKTS